MAIDQLNVLGRVGHRGMAVRTAGKNGYLKISDAAFTSRPILPRKFTTSSLLEQPIVVTDAPATRSSSASNSVFLMEPAKK
jgi:hypothetical protein